MTIEPFKFKPRELSITVAKFWHTDNNGRVHWEREPVQGKKDPTHWWPARILLSKSHEHHFFVYWSFQGVHNLQNVSLRELKVQIREELRHLEFGRDESGWTEAIIVAHFFGLRARAERILWKEGHGRIACRVWDEKKQIYLPDVDHRTTNHIHHYGINVKDFIPFNQELWEVIQTIEAAATQFQAADSKLKDVLITRVKQWYRQPERLQELKAVLNTITATIQEHTTDLQKGEDDDHEKKSTAVQA